MTLIYEREKAELVESVDTFYMMKIMYDEGLPLEKRHYHQVYPMQCFILSLKKLEKRYPYFKIHETTEEEVADELELLFKIDVHSNNEDIKKALSLAFKSADNYYGEFDIDWRGDTLYVSGVNYVIYHDLLKVFIKQLKKVSE